MLQWGYGLNLIGSYLITRIGVGSNVIGLRKSCSSNIFKSACIPWSFCTVEAFDSTVAEVHVDGSNSRGLIIEPFCVTTVLDSLYGGLYGILCGMGKLLVLINFFETDDLFVVLGSSSYSELFSEQSDLIFIASLNAFPTLSRTIFMSTRSHPFVFESCSHQWNHNMWASDDIIHSS